MAEQLLY